MKENLSQRAANHYEQGLVALGKLLGADAHEPEAEARADAIWRWTDEMWAAWEAKSEAKDENDIRPMTSAGQHPLARSLEGLRR